VEQQKIEQIYERLGALSIDLPRDPTSLGADFLREVISVCRNYLNETAHYLQDVLVEESFLAMKLDGEEAAYQIQSAELLATDPRVSPAIRPNIADRQAYIDTLLAEQKRSIVHLQAQIRTLGYVKAVVRARQTELNNTMSSIRLQRSLLKDDLRTGAFYGDESPVSRGNGGVDPVDRLGTADLEALVAASEQELVEEAALATTVEPGASSADPADSLDPDALEALICSGESSASVPAVESEEDLQAAIERFLLEPDDDVATLVQNS